VQAGARHVEFLADGYEVSIPRHKALAHEVLLAWEMNGAPLEPDHGAPLRVVVPGYIGARSVKWVTGVRALAEPSQGYYQAVAYRLDPGSIALGAVAVNADILVPGGVGQRRRDPARARGGDLESRWLRQQFLGAR
jgi:sulfite oxidase